MRAIATTRDHKEDFTNEQLERVKQYVGPNAFIRGLGIDDQYTTFGFSTDCSDEVVYFVFRNNASLWGVLDEGIEFESLDELKQIAKEMYREMFDDELKFE